MTNSDLVLLNEAQKQQGGAAVRQHAERHRREHPPPGPADLRRAAAAVLLPRRGLRRRAPGPDAHGFPRRDALYGVPGTPMAECFESFPAAIEHCEQLIERLHELDFEIDGLVLKVNRYDQRERLGSTSKAPRWVIAYKFEKYEATTRLKAIQVQVGKSGAITPVAILEPVEIAGTSVCRASLHNADEIRKKDVRVGDVVVVEKAGKIIPHIVRVEAHLRNRQMPAFTYPMRCPACGEWLITDEGEYLFGTRQWPERILHYLKPFPDQKHDRNIKGLGIKRVRKLVASARIRGYGDLYRIQQNDLECLKGMKEEDIDGILKKLEQSKNWGLERVLAALAIEGVGPWTATRLAEGYTTIDRLTGASAEQIAAVEGVPPVVGKVLPLSSTAALGARLSRICARAE